MNEIKIHDIKALVDVSDYSIYFYYSLILAFVVIFCLIIYFIYRFLKNRKENIRKKYFNILENIDFENSKKSAYEITKYGQLLAVEDDEKQLLLKLLDNLENYKYKKNVPSFNKDTKELFDNFMDTINV